jgi:hypothetical protein
MSRLAAPNANRNFAEERHADNGLWCPTPVGGRRLESVLQIE